MACQQLRSISLPLRSHALVQDLEDELHRLRSSAAASASPAALAARLGDAYGRVEELVRLPGGRDALSSARWRRAVEAGLDASVALLDLCDRARDTAANAKQHARAARRALRRGDAELVTSALRGYARCLTKAGKQAGAARKALSKGVPDAEAPSAVKLLSELVAETVAVVQSAMASLSARVVDTRKSRWCVVARLMRGDWSRTCVCKELDGEGGAAEETLQELEDSVEGLENGLEHLFRHIVQSRVALLNVLTL